MSHSINKKHAEQRRFGVTAEFHDAPDLDVAHMLRGITVYERPQRIFPVGNASVTGKTRAEIGQQTLGLPTHLSRSAREIEE